MHATRPSRLWITAATIVLGLGTSFAAVLPPGVQRTEPATAEQLAADAAAYRQHITTLSNPFMEGRAPGTRGNRVAADYVEFHFNKLGLKPAFPTETKSGAG